jgi:bacteriocin leader peptide (microcyclamide/patellamide family)
MNKKNISPNPLQPIDRVPTGQLPSALAELSEEAIGEQALSPALSCLSCLSCSYDGDDE